MDLPPVVLDVCGNCSAPVDAGHWYCYQCGNPVQFRLVRVDGQLRATARLPPPPAFGVARPDHFGHRQGQGMRQAQQPQVYGVGPADYAGRGFQGPPPPNPPAVNPFARHQHGAAANPFARRGNDAARNNDRAQRGPVPVAQGGWQVHRPAGNGVGRGGCRQAQPMAVVRAPAPAPRAVARPVVAAPAPVAAARPQRRRRRNRGRRAGAQPARQADQPGQVQNAGPFDIRPVCRAVANGNAARHGHGQAVGPVVVLRSRGGPPPRTPPPATVAYQVVEPVVEAVEPTAEPAAETVDHVDNASAADQDVQPSDVPEVEENTVEQPAETVDQAAEAEEQAAANVDNVDVPPSNPFLARVEDAENHEGEGEASGEAGNEAGDQATDQ